MVRRPLNQFKQKCQTDCPKKEICQQIDVEECETVRVRICDQLPPEKCQKPKPEIKKRIVLKCTEIAEIAPDLYHSLNSNSSQ